MKFLRRVLLVVIAVLAIAWFVLPGIVENRMNKVLNPPPPSSK